MFKWQRDNNFSFFILDNSGIKIPVEKWEAVQDSYLSELSILKEFVENGFGEYTGDTCEVEIIDVLALNEIDKQILNLPYHYPYDIYIKSDGQLNEASFKFNCGFYDFIPNGNQLSVKRDGPIVEFAERRYLLSVNQFYVCEAIDNFNALPEKERTFQKNLKSFADVKAFSRSAASILDAYLESQNVCCPDKIKIDFSFENGVLEIIPDIGIDNVAGFVKAFDRFSSVKDIYPVSDNDGGTTRIIFDEKQKTELERIHGKRKISDKKVIEDLAENPEAFFDDEIFDLTAFYSDRVKEIGIYKPKFYPFVCPYKSEWIPGISIKDRNTGEKRIYFKNIEKLTAFEDETTAAQKAGRVTVDWEECEIPIDIAERSIQLAYKQFENSEVPIKQSEEGREEVLIIKENAELLEYSEQSNFIENFEHFHSEIHNLNGFVTLKDHQKEGIAWLQSLHKKNVSGCLLADDMGLGKTLQLLYYIEWHAQFYNHSKPYLIVAPVSLLENWENEYDKFFSPKSLPLKVLYGEVELSKEYNKVQVKELQKRQIILTNYETLKAYQFNLCAIDFALVVLDEAQKIKTPGTFITNVCKALKADFKIAMTGTPVENTYVDLWCILDFSVPGLLGNAKEFAKEFQNPLKNAEVDIEELGKRLNNKIGIFIKRRLKRDVAKDLPAKFDNEVSKRKRQMPEKQLQRYKIEIDNAKNSDLSGVARSIQILKSLQAIRDISDHPFLVDSQISNYKSEDLVSTSAKLQILIELLTEIKANNDKVIVFADRKETQKMLQQVVRDYFNLYPSIVNGDTPSTKKGEGKSKLSRQQTIDRYQSVLGFNVIIMSQLAAGVGLNVTGANHVIHYSRHWNPAKEQQATDRAYRIGQMKDVHVYYPMAISDEFESFDLILDKLLSRKISLAASALFPSERAEVKPDEMYGNVFNFNAEIDNNPLELTEIDSLQPHLFEAYVAALYSKMGFITHLTPNSNDKGVDVIAIKKGESYIIQAKQSRSVIGNNGVQEISAAKKYYEAEFGEKFELILFANNDFTPAAITLANANQVKLIHRRSFEKLATENQVFIQEVRKHESQRIKTI